MITELQISQIDWPALAEQYSDQILASALNVIAATIILIIGLWVAGAVAGAVKRATLRHPRIDITLASFFSSIVRYTIITFVLVAVLNRFGVETTSIIAVLGAGALAIGLALQGTLSNVAAGVMIILFRPYRIGDFVEVGGREGTVTRVSLFVTELNSLANLKLVLPNGLCWGAPMVNFTANPTRRIDLEFGVAYDTDLTKAIEVVQRTVRADSRVRSDPEPFVKIKTLGDFAITILARYWCATDEFLALQFDLTKSVKEAFDEAGIVIPFPTATNYEYHMGDPADADASGEGTKYSAT